MNSLCRISSMSLSCESKIAESRSYCKNELGFSFHFIDMTSLFLIHSGDPQLMTGLNKKALIPLFSLFCHLCLQNISGVHYMLGVFTFLFLTLTTTLKVGIFILILLGRKKLKITDFKINGPRDVPLSKRSEIWTYFSVESPDIFYYILFIKNFFKYLF